MPSVNLGPAVLQTTQYEAAMMPQNTALRPAETATNGLRLIAFAKAVSLISTGDVVQMPIINASVWSPVTVVTNNGQVSGVQGSIATASVGIFTAAASGGVAVKTQAALAANSAAGSSIAIPGAAASIILSFTGQFLFVNVGTALANAQVDIYVYGYDQSAF